MHRTALNRRQAQTIDELAVRDYGMSSLQLMENAGRGLADTIIRLGIAGPVAICCGTGNNGGDGFVMARHLEVREISVRVALCGDPARLQGDAQTNYEILRRADFAIQVFTSEEHGARVREFLTGAAWIVDALLGTGARGAPRPLMAAMIEQMNAHTAPKLAVDLPSGMDCDTGLACEPTIRAAHTCTFVSAKLGFSQPKAEHYTGQVHVLDIGAPRKLLDHVLGGASA